MLALTETTFPSSEAAWGTSDLSTLAEKTVISLDVQALTDPPSLATSAS
jgi:hypothetical protein